MNKIKLKPIAKAISVSLCLGFLSNGNSLLAAGFSENNFQEMHSDSIQIVGWEFEGEDASIVSSAQVSGLYSVADDKGYRIEIRNIKEEQLFPRS